MTEELKDQITEEIVETKETKKEKKTKQQLKIESLEQEVKELNDKYLRTLAETENYKKRITQERINDRKYAATNFALELLTPYEQFSKIVEFPSDNELLNNFLIGFKMIRDQFKDALEKKDVVK